MSEQKKEEVAPLAGGRVASQVFTAMARYGNAVADLPSSVDDYDYHMSYRGFKAATRKHAEEMLTVIDTVGRAHVTSTDRFAGVGSVAAVAGDAAGEVKKSKKKAGSGMLEEQRQIIVLDLVDSLLENVDTALDEARGEKVKSASQLNVTFGSGTGGEGEFGHYALKNRKQQQAAPGTVGFQSSGAALRHQTYFSQAVDNTADHPFEHMKYPLVEITEDFDTAAYSWSAPPRVADHPYKSQIEGLTVPAFVLQPSLERSQPSLESTPLVPVETLEQLKAMILDILAPLAAAGTKTGAASAVEIAIDLEHHNQHSFQGYTCLMQLSTRTTDYIVDVISLRDHLHLLNKSVLLEPKILKVLHGANEDVRWLQKDFGCYIVNMFDTGIALQCLQMPHGLGFCVDHFCQVKLDKKYQTADWRLRPLPADFIQYARMDTHYLLYCYDRLKQLLLNADTSSGSGPAMAAKGGSSNLLMSVLKQSKSLCLTSYAKPVQNLSLGYKEAMGRSLGGLNSMQLNLVRKLYNWRDQQARAQDESPPSVMHASSILQLACKAPTSPSDILKAASPVSAILRKSVPELAALIKAEVDLATENGVKTAEVDNTTTASGQAGASGSRSYLATGDDQRFARHMPMTGTLPSIEANFSPAVVTVQQQQYHHSSSSPAQGSSWIASGGWVNQQNTAQQQAASKKASALMGGAAHPVDLPLCLLKAKRLRQAAPMHEAATGVLGVEEESAEEEDPRVVGQRSERTADQQGTDEDREVKRRRLEQDDAAPSAAGTAGVDEGSDSENEGKNIGNLRTAYKGLGRDTRRREGTAVEAEIKTPSVLKKASAKKK